MSSNLKKVLAVTGGVLAVLAAILTQLGGQAPPRPSTVRSAPPRSVVASALANRCSQTDYATQCALAAQPKPPLTITQGAPVLHGVDFAWGGPRSCSQMRALGARFGASYLSFDPSKDWNRALVDSFHACGIATVSVWETSAGRATQGFAAGASDARNAGSLAAGLGNTHDAISFAIDFDANGPEVYSYFKGAQSVLGGRVNAYGGYRPIAYLHAHGAVGNLNWQTYAWSGGAWLPASIAPLEQYNNISPVYDLDRAIAANYGQSPAPQTGPTPATLHLWEQVKNSAFRVYRHDSCAHPQDKNPYCSREAALVVLYQHKLWANGTPKRWACFGPQTQHQPKALLKSEICWIVRPQAAWYAGARDASKDAFDRHVCGGANGQVGLTKPCKVWRQREIYFGAKVKALVAAYS